MDALELLKTDHERVNGLFEQFRTTTGFQGRKQIFMNIYEELETHANVEETIVYPAFRNYPEFKELLDRSYKDHDTVKQELRSLLDQLERGEARIDIDDFTNRVNRLADSVNKHVTEEESELFPLVRQHLRRPERERMGRHIQAAKDERREQAA